jgi:PD-(D/E)XK nuclease family transposase
MIMDEARKYTSPIIQEILRNIPEIFKDEIFEKAFQQAEIAKFSENERHDYEQSLKIYRDLKNVIDTAFDEGIIKVAKLMKLNNEPIEKIIKYTELTKEQIDRF